MKTANVKKSKKANRIMGYESRIRKLACGQKATVPGYATVRAYKSNHGRRMFAISSLAQDGVRPSGNLPLETVLSDIREYAR